MRPTQSSAASALCLCVRGRSTCCTWMQNLPRPLFCITPTVYIPGFPRAGPVVCSNHTPLHVCMKACGVCGCVISFESNPKSHQERTGCHARGSPLFVLCRKQDAQTEESPSAGDGAPAVRWGGGGGVTWNHTEVCESSFQCHITDLQVPISACEPTQ